MLRKFSETLHRFLSPRSVWIEQWSGFSMIFVAILTFLRPPGIALALINSAYGFNLPLHTFTVLFFVCGWLLAWRRTASTFVFATLTIPYLAYGGLLFAYTLSKSDASSTSAAVSIVAYFLFQYAFVRERSPGRR